MMVDRIAIIQNGAIIDIRELTAQTSDEFYVEVGQVEAFEQLAGDRARREKSGFIVALSREAMPNFVREVVAANIDVFTIQPVTKGLEEQFIEMTGGGAIDAIR